MNAVLDLREFAEHPATVYEERHDDARREIRVGAVVIGSLVALFLIWGTLVRLDAAAFAVGAVAVEGHRQAVQHKDGGIVSRIDVREGGMVKAGQVLISLAPAEVEAAERAMSSQVISLQAQRARLEAEQVGAWQVPMPREFADLTGDDAERAKAAMRLQQAELAARRAASGGQKKVLAQRGTQLNEAVRGFHDQNSAVGTQSDLIEDELKGLRALAAKGFASMNRVRELERAQASLKGQSSELDANAARATAQMGEMKMQALSIDTDRMESIAKDVRDTNFQLNDLLPKLHAIREQLAHTQIRAPASGRVVGLTVFTVGGVVAPGQKLMDIVPDERPIMVSAKMSPNDTDGVHVGQLAELKVTAIRDRTLPILQGRVTSISADALTDERTGQQYFTIDVDIPADEVAKIRSMRGPEGALRTGQPVEVVIPMRPRTALEYMLEPLTNAFWRSFHER